MKNVARLLVINYCHLVFMSLSVIFSHQQNFFGANRIFFNPNNFFIGIFKIFFSIKNNKNNIFFVFPFRFNLQGRTSVTLCLRQEICHL